MTDNEDSGNIKNDSVNPARPNANYKLSKGDNQREDELHFHYNRERRLAKAPPAVRDLYTEKKPSRFNLLRPLVSNKPKAMLFFTIIILSVSIYVLGISGYFDNSWKLDGNKIEIKATRFEDMVIMFIQKTVSDKERFYTGSVDIAVTVKADEYPVFYHRIFFSSQDKEDYRFTVPFDSKELIIILQTEKTTINIKLKPE
jgi:hypothetical protein